MALIALLIPCTGVCFGVAGGTVVIKGKVGYPARNTAAEPPGRLCGRP